MSVREPIETGAARSGRLRRLAPLAAGLGIVAVGAGLVAVVAGGGSEEAGTTVRPVAVRTAAVRVLPSYPVERTFLGRVEPRRESVLGFELPGVVASVAVEEGDVVAAGQTLATLDVAKLTARQAEWAARLAAAGALLAELEAGPRTEAIAAAAADAARLQALAEQAELTSRRTAGMRERGAVTARETDDARLSADAAKAGLAAALAGLRELRAGTRPNVSPPSGRRWRGSRRRSAASRWTLPTAN